MDKKTETMTEQELERAADELLAASEIKDAPKKKSTRRAKTEEKPAEEPTEVKTTEDILNEHKEALRFDHIEADEHIGKVSIVGAGLMSNCGVAAKMFEALYEAGINIQMVNTSEIRVSVLLDEGDVNRAVKAIHAKFFDEL